MVESINIPLVNIEDEIIGYGEKLETHKNGILHRAFSILVYNKDKELLIHQRALGKYHSGGLWTNTCCGHPNEGENMESAVHRRLKEEMGFDCELKFLFKFQYKATFDNGLIENEIDHVYVGEFNENFVVNSEEVAAFRWLNMVDLKREIAEKPNIFTVWFKEIMKKEFSFQ